MTKPIRIFTNRDFPDGKSVEWIEAVNGGFMWKADDHSMGEVTSCGFPVDEAFVREKFASVGREFDPSKMPR